MLNAANTAFKNKQNVSLRFGGSPNCLYPWLARIFYDHLDETISKKYFIDKWQDKNNFKYGPMRSLGIKFIEKLKFTKM